MKNVYIYPEWRNWENNYIKNLSRDKVEGFLEDLGFYDIYENYYMEIAKNEKPARYNFDLKSAKCMDDLFIRLSDFEVELFTFDDIKNEYTPKEMSGLKNMWRDFMSEQFPDYRKSLNSYLERKEKFYSPQYDRPLYR